MSNHVVNGEERESDPITSAERRQRTIERSLGETRRTGITWIADWNYISHYNESIRNR